MHPAAGPFFPPSPPPLGAAKEHTAKLLAEDKQTHGDGAKPALEEQQCPGPASTWAMAAEQVTQASSAVAWLCLGMWERLTPNPVPGMLGRSQAPGESQETSALPQHSSFGSYPWIEFPLNWGACSC